MAVATAVLFVLVGGTDLWHEEGGSDSVAVDVLWWIVWVVYTLAKIVLIGVLVATVYQWYVSRQESSVRS